MGRVGSAVPAVTLLHPLLAITDKARLTQVTLLANRPQGLLVSSLDSLLKLKLLAFFFSFKGIN